jgi:hypothetical protein
MLQLILILAIVFVAWVVFKPARLPKPPDNRVTKLIERSALDTQTVSNSWLDRVGNRFGDRRKQTAKLLQARASEIALSRAGDESRLLASEASEFAAWLKALPEKELLLFLDHVSAFCRAVDVDPAWLTDAKADPELKSVAEDAVLFFGLARRKALGVKGLILYSAWQAAPQKSEYRDFAQKLYNKLVQDGLAKVSPDLMLASDKERQAFVTKEIQAAAAANRDVFLAAVKSVADESAPAAEPAKAAPGGASAEIPAPAAL